MKKLFLILIPFVIVACNRPTDVAVKTTKRVDTVTVTRPVKNEFLVLSVETHDDDKRISLYKVGDYECLRTAGYQAVSIQCFDKSKNEPVSPVLEEKLEK